MQEQNKIEMVWQAPELVELGAVIDETKFNNGHHADVSTASGS